MNSPLHPTNRIHCATCVPYSTEERWLSVSAIFLHKKIELVYPYIDEDKVEGEDTGTATNDERREIHKTHRMGYYSQANSKQVGGV